MAGLAVPHDELSRGTGQLDSGTSPALEGSAGSRVIESREYPGLLLEWKRVADDRDVSSWRASSSARSLARDARVFGLSAPSVHEAFRPATSAAPGEVHLEWGRLNRCSVREEIPRARADLGDDLHPLAV